MGKKIVLSGYYGFQNLGDEAILYSMVQAFRRYSDVELVVLSNQPEYTEKQYGVRAVNRWKIFSLAKEIASADLVISGGGSLLQDVTGPRSIYYYLGVVFLAKLLGKKTMFYAQGIGPVTTEQGKKLIHRVGNRVDLISVRDPESKRLLEQLGVERPDIRLTVDPVLGIDPGQVDVAVGKKRLGEMGVNLTGEPVIGVSLREWRNPDNYKAVVAKACDELIEKGHKIMVLPFHFPGDIGAGRDMVKLMEHGEQVILIKNQLTVEEMLGVLSQLKLIVGMRLHALIMASVMGIPLIGISYDPKVDSFMKQVGQPVAGRAETITEEELSGTIAEVLASYEEQLPEYWTIAAEKRAQSLETSAWAYELLS